MAFLVLCAVKSPLFFAPFVFAFLLNNNNNGVTDAATVSSCSTWGKLSMTQQQLKHHQSLDRFLVPVEQNGSKRQLGCFFLVGFLKKNRS